MGIKVKSQTEDVEKEILNKFSSLGLEIVLPIDEERETSEKKEEKK